MTTTTSSRVQCSYINGPTNDFTSSPLRRITGSTQLGYQVTGATGMCVHTSIGLVLTVQGWQLPYRQSREHWNGCDMLGGGRARLLRRFANNTSGEAWWFSKLSSLQLQVGQNESHSLRRMKISPPILPLSTKAPRQSSTCPVHGIAHSNEIKPRKPMVMKSSN